MKWRGYASQYYSVKLLSILLCLALGTTYFIVRRDQTRAGVRQLVLPKFNANEVDAIEIDGRRMSGRPEYVAALLDAAANLQIDRFSTESMNPKMTTVRLLHQGKVVWQLEIGDEVEGGRLVRAPGTKAIFVARGKFADLLGTWFIEQQ